MSKHLFVRFGLLVAVVLLAGVGCRQYYNGAIGIGGDDYKAVRDYHRQREQRLINQEKALAERSRNANKKNHTTSRIIDPTNAGTDKQEPVIHPKPKTKGTPEYFGNPDQNPDQTPGDQDPAEKKDGPDSQSSIFPPNVENLVTTKKPQADVHRSPFDPYGKIAGTTTKVSPLDTTGQLRRVSTTREGADFDVTIDASGAHMVYASTRHRKTADIYRQKIDGSAITQLTNDPGNDLMPALSPDGKTIAFTSDRSGNWDLYLMDAKGGPAVQLTNDRTHDIHPSFSPDGKTLVYCSLSERSGQWQMVTIDVANPTTKRYIGHGLFPQWSPTGKTILYQRARERGTRWFSVWTVELNDKGEAGSPTEIAWSSSYACITPSWSPDGKAVVFCTVMNPDADTQGRPAASDVWLAKADGSRKTRLTQGRYSNLQPAWSGDNSIYFVSNRAAKGVENIWALDPDDAIKVAFPAPKKSKTKTVDVPPTTD